ncbi:putative transcription factor C2H2 family [Medicago truncatula]|uniref:RBR-type E3 ubiquitin transferase n=1 Tax=Medicago truncatula TaxID=3880 RepID=A0A396IPI2_MEDTR|nr:putative transcription factor C2H2 family [Medicago truncatula]
MFFSLKSKSLGSSILFTLVPILIGKLVITKLSFLVLPGKKYLSKQLSSSANFHEASIEPSDKQSCGICFELKTYSDMFQTTKCKHLYCLDCICKYVTFQINNNLVKVITCPSPNCFVQLKPNELQHNLPKQVTFRWESLIYESSITFKFMSYARKLFQNFKLDKKFLELAKRERWKRCPSCSIYVERINGCNHMMCRCGSDFCYKCGVTLKYCECMRARFNVRPSRINFGEVTLFF